MAMMLWLPFHYFVQSLDQASVEGRRQRERQRGEFLEVHSSRKVAPFYTVPLCLYHKE